MSPEDEAAKYARKGKAMMREDDAGPSIPSPEPTSRQRANIYQRVLNAAAPMRPFSFGSFLPTSEPAVRPFSNSSFLPTPAPAARPLSYSSFFPTPELTPRPFSYSSLLPIPAPASRPFSHSSLLPTSEPATIHFPSSLPPTTGQQIDQIIAGHNENLRNALYATVEKKAEELAAKKIHEKELEIYAKVIEGEKVQEKIDQYTDQIERLLGRETNWKKTIKHLNKKLKEANVARGEMWKEDTAESSHANTELVERVRLDCMVCEKIVATIMMWPCRHVCVCSTCNESTKVCPVCGMQKISTIAVSIPTYD